MLFSPGIIRGMSPDRFNDIRGAHAWCALQMVASMVACCVAYLRACGLTFSAVCWPLPRSVAGCRHAETAADGDTFSSTWMTAENVELLRTDLRIGLLDKFVAIKVRPPARTLILLLTLTLTLNSALEVRSLCVRYNLDFNATHPQHHSRVYRS